MPKCPMCLEEVDELVEDPEDSEEVMCIECLDEVGNQRALYDEETRQSEEDQWYDEDEVTL